MHFLSMKARERSGFYSSSFNSNDGTDASTACPETNQQDMLRDSPLLCVDKVDEFNITEPEPVSELEREENRLLMGSNGLGVDAQSATCPDDPGVLLKTTFLVVCLTPNSN